MRVAVAMSGGVDSLRTAALLKNEGYDVFGIHMQILPASRTGRWCAATVLRTQKESVEALASRLEIPIFFVDLREDFEKWVISPFLDAYRAGLTPNPCVVCNPRVKFGFLLEEARRLGAERLATGHYVRLASPDSTSGRFCLMQARDMTKDQSYFLYGLTQEQLEAALFPLGSSTKEETLDWAGRNGLDRYVTAESQEICFIPSGHYREFLHERLDLPSSSSASGPIIDMQGRVLGRHNGIFSYTVGQRRGLGIASTAPYYVVNIDPESSTVQVGRAEDLLCRELLVASVNWVSIPPPEEPLRCRVRIRNQHRPERAWITPSGSDGVSVSFDVPQRAVTPGQAAVFYDDALVLGGGVIVKGHSGPRASLEQPL